MVTQKVSVVLRPIMTETTDQQLRIKQHAHDLFHQDEFEQASYLYLDILQSRSDCNEARVGLSAAYYFLGNYNQAVSYAIHSSNSITATFLNRFHKQCEVMSGHQ